MSAILSKELLLNEIDGLLDNVSWINNNEYDEKHIVSCILFNGPNSSLIHWGIGSSYSIASSILVNHHIKVYEHCKVDDRTNKEVEVVEEFIFLI